MISSVKAICLTSAIALIVWLCIVLTACGQIFDDRSTPDDTYDTDNTTHPCEHADGNADHRCDTCGKEISEHIDKNSDHKCDICKYSVSEHSDKNGDHLCDECTARISPCSDTLPADHRCDVCGRALDGCVDENGDHLCDKCNGKASDHYDGADDGHDCDVCNQNLCTDSDRDCFCDICAEALCTDSNGDHACDSCGKNLCYDSDDRGHTCDVCGKSMCLDGNDADCLCDICGDHACSNPEHSHLLPVIKVYADGENCTVNGVKITTFLGGEESFAVMPLYNGSEYTLDRWVVYDEKNIVVAKIEKGELFIPSEYGTYYVVPIFVSEEAKNI